MEGLASNFEAVLSQFKENLQGALYVAVDMELTGTSLDNSPDRYEEYAEERLDKVCQIAESYIPIQIGATIVKHEGGSYKCASYNFYALPWQGPEVSEPDPNILCRLSAMKFNADSNAVDFNKWLRHGVRYMTREDESRYLASPASHEDKDLPQKTGLLRLWKLLCESKLPLVTHCPLDIFFLLTCFECRKLPRDPRKLSQLVSRCLPHIFDTAHLHSIVGGFKNLQLVKFLEEAQARQREHALKENLQICCFQLEQETEQRYGSGRNLAHEAGFDSLCAAQLYACLLNLSQDKVMNAVNRLFLYKSTECLDLNQAANTGDISSSISEHIDEVPYVAKNDHSLRKQLSACGVPYRLIDNSHLLILLSSAHSDLALKFGMPPFEQWRATIRAQAQTVDEDDDRLPDNSSRSSSISDCMLESVVGQTHSSAQSWLESASAQAWLDGVIEPRYFGVIKAFDSSKGYGFIASAETYDIYKRDVFLHHRHVHGLDIGQPVSFAVSMNARGQPQAKDVSACHGRTYDMESDEVQTTIGASSTIDSDGASDDGSSLM